MENKFTKINYEANKTGTESGASERIKKLLRAPATIGGVLSALLKLELYSSLGADFFIREAKNAAKAFEETEGKTTGQESTTEPE